jgi:hypothetical protein
MIQTENGRVWKERNETMCWGMSEMLPAEFSICDHGISQCTNFLYAKHFSDDTAAKCETISVHPGLQNCNAVDSQARFL